MFIHIDFCVPGINNGDSYWGLSLSDDKHAKVNWHRLEDKYESRQAAYDAAIKLPFLPCKICCYSDQGPGE